MPSMDTWTMVQLREECAKLDITPGRSKAETAARIMAGRVRPGNLGAMINAAAREAIMSPAPAPRPPRMSKLARGLCAFTALCTTLRYLPAWVYRGGELAWCSTPQGWAWRMMPPNHLRGLSPDNFRAFGATDRRF